MSSTEKGFKPWERFFHRLEVASVYLGNFVRRYKKYRIFLAPLAALLGLAIKPSMAEAEHFDDLTTLDTEAEEVLGDHAEDVLDGTEGGDEVTALPDFEMADLVMLENVTGADLLSDLETVRTGDEREELETYLLEQGYTSKQIAEGLDEPAPGEYDPANTHLISEANLPPLGPFDPVGKPLWEIQRRIVDLNIWEDWHRQRAFDDAGRDDLDGWQSHEDDADDLWNQRFDLENIANEIIRRQRKPDTDTGEEPSQFREWPRVVGEFVRDCLQPRVVVPAFLVIAAATLVWLVNHRQQRAT